MKTLLPTLFLLSLAAALGAACQDDSTGSANASAAGAAAVVDAGADTSAAGSTARDAAADAITPPLDASDAGDANPDTGPPPGPGFLHAEGREIVDGSGTPFLMRAMGFGGWMVQEPYMMQASASASEGQHSLFEDVEELIGPDRLATYHQAWLDNYCTEADVAELKASGFNSLRLAMHYNLFTLPIEDEPTPGTDTWLDRGFEMVDELLGWCRQHEIYLVLDLHAAPGGQGQDANICDYDSSKPSLWDDTENQRKTIALWSRLAQRYVDEDWIGGYDLLNEPNWGFEDWGSNGCNENGNIPLKTLTDDIVAEIRTHDTNHLIFIEGNCWGGNHNNMWPIADDNVALSFHRYWTDNTYDTIAQYVDLGAQYDVPIWMGESGENDNQWYFDAIELLEGNNIGWAWWTWKKLDSGSGSYSVTPPDGYQTLLDYWQNGGTPPDADFAFNVMMELTDNLLLDSCSRNSGAIDALTQGHN